MKQQSKKTSAANDTKSSLTESSLSPAKKRAFTVILLLFPILVLLVTELSLRFFQYGGNLDLVTTTTILGKEYYTLNRDVARRYFSQKGVGIPEAYDDLFQIVKPEKTKRIFMLGESTMAGYPFDYNATAPRLLQDRLCTALPNYSFEVINCGLAATNSYTVLDFAKELAGYSPDAYVVYVGHNEFYGAMGVGSTEYLGQWRWMINLYLHLRDLKLFLLMRDGIVGLRNLFREDATPDKSTLMSAMVREKTIPYNSDEYRIARTSYEANLRDLIAFCKERRIPLVISTLTSNLRDQKPLLSIFAEQTTEESKNRWHSFMREGDSHFNTNDIQSAIETYKKAIALDTMQADAHYALARCYDRLSDYASAKTEYMKARDYDGLRFRASTDFNNMVSQLCAETQTPLADAETVFQQHSPNGITDTTLMMEHLHPNFNGYFLLAKAFAEPLYESGILAPKTEWRMELVQDDSSLQEQSGVTEFDLEAANFRIFELTHNWPFVKEQQPKQEYPANDFAANIAVQYVKKQIAWSKARTTLAEWYSKQGDYIRAAKEYNAQAKVMWYYYLPLMNMGDIYNSINDTLNAERCYLRGLERQDSPFLHVRLGMLYYNSNRVTESIQQFEAIFSNATASLEMNANDRSTARYFLAAAYWANRNREKTVSNLRLALDINPNNSEARAMLDKLSH